MKKRSLITLTMLLTQGLLPIKAIEKQLSVPAQKAFKAIQKTWNSKENNIIDLDRNVINEGMNKITDSVALLLDRTTQPIPLTEVVNLINTINDLKDVYTPIATNLPAGTVTTLKNIFNTAKDFHKKLIETHHIIQTNNVAAELVDHRSPFDGLAYGFLLIIVNNIKNHNATVAQQVPLTPLQKEDEKKESQKIEALLKSLYLATQQ